MEKIEQIAMEVMELTDTDFKEAQECIEEQKSYNNPLKMVNFRSCK